LKGGLKEDVVRFLKGLLSDLALEEIALGGWLLDNRNELMRSVSAHVVLFLQFVEEVLLA